MARYNMVLKVTNNRVKAGKFAQISLSEDEFDLLDRALPDHIVLEKIEDDNGAKKTTGKKAK